MKYLIILALLFSPTALATNKPKPPAPQNVPDSGSNHNGLIIAAFIAAGVCVYYKCWKTPVQDNDPNRVTPEVPKNEYIRITPR